MIRTYRVYVTHEVKQTTILEVKAKSQDDARKASVHLVKSISTLEPEPEAHIPHEHEGRNTAPVEGVEPTILETRPARHSRWSSRVNEI